MYIEDDKKEQIFLKLFGFKKKWLGDKSGFWFRKKIKHKYFKKCEIIVQDFRGKAMITVDCLDLVEDGGMVTISSNEYSKKNLLKILTFLSEK